MENQEYLPRWPEWRTVRKIGTGSFGSVYEIEKQIFDRVDKAALKVISIPKSSGDIDELYADGYDKRSIITRYESYLKDLVSEYNFMIDLKGNPNVVHCEDLRYEKQSDGIGWNLYIKMELLTPLIRVLKTPVDENQVIKLGVDICNVLIACKKKNIIHRDIKPQNIFVAANGDFKLGDFGIAKTSERTTSGTVAGTYKYMAPEVYNNQPYGASSDMYSLGMVLYWMLNERRGPFLPLPPAAPTSTQDAEARIYRMTGKNIPAPKNGSPALKQIVLKACQYNPEHRFSSPEEMRSALIRASNGGIEVPYFNTRNTINNVGVRNIGSDDKTTYIIPDAPNNSVRNTPPPIIPDTPHIKPRYQENTLDIHTDYFLSEENMKNGATRKVFVAELDKHIQVEFPPNLEDGDEVRIAKQGYYDAQRNLRGDLYITVHEIPEDTDDEIAAPARFKRPWLNPLVLSITWIARIWLLGMISGESDGNSEVAVVLLLVALIGDIMQASKSEIAKSFGIALSILFSLILALVALGENILTFLGFLLMSAVFITGVVVMYFNKKKSIDDDNSED